MKSDTLEARVRQFQMLELPGQPMAMHMGTSYLVEDLLAEVKRLRSELADEKAIAESMSE
jgi:hypothetical protein